jgi:hypothetical protein
LITRGADPSRARHTKWITMQAPQAPENQENLMKLFLIIVAGIVGAVVLLSIL